MDGYATVVARISQLDSLIRSSDPSWQGSGLGIYAIGSGNSGTAANPVRLDSNSPFAGVLEQTYNAAAAPAASGEVAAVGSAGSPVNFADYPDTLASPATNGDHGAIEFESTADVLARYDKVSSTIPYAAQIRDAAIRNGIDPLLLVGLVNSESGFDTNATSRCGAKGLTQLMPGTARGLGVTDVNDPAQNLNGGARYLAIQLKRFGRIDLALAAYSAGPGAVARAGGLPVTRQPYVRKILRTFDRYKAAAA
jgi:soluble lytic murein transglycosylase-like protein